MKKKFNIALGFVALIILTTIYSCSKNESDDLSNNLPTSEKLTSNKRFKVAGESGGSGGSSTYNYTNTTNMGNNITRVSRRWSNSQSGNATWNMLNSLGVLICSATSSWFVAIPMAEDTYWLNNTQQIYYVKYIDTSSYSCLSIATGVNASFVDTYIQSTPFKYSDKLTVSTSDKHARVKCVITGFHPNFSCQPISGVIQSPDDFYLQ